MLNTHLLEELNNIKDQYYIYKMETREYDNSVILHISIDRLSKRDKGNHVSKLQIENLVKNLSSKYENRIEVLYTESERLNNVLKGIELLLMANFSEINKVNFTLLSAEEVSTEIYLDNLNEDKKDSIKKFIEPLFHNSQIEVVNIEWIGDIEEYPSSIEILIALKEVQPVSLENLNSKLNLRDIRWLNRQLDKFIKKDLLVRDKASEQYSLTGKGLGIIPSIPNYSNSDIKRALSLGYRKW